MFPDFRNSMNLDSRTDPPGNCCAHSEYILEMLNSSSAMSSRAFIIPGFVSALAY